MKNSVHNLLCCIFMLLLTTQTQSQDTYFFSSSQNSLSYNSPLAGTLAGLFVGNLHFQSGYKNKWQSENKSNRKVALNKKNKMASTETDHYFIMSHHILYDKLLTTKRTTTPTFWLINYHQSSNRHCRSYTIDDGVDISDLSATGNGKFISESTIFYQNILSKITMEKNHTQRRI